MADQDLGLSERDKELKRWNAPYVYREFPKMLYLGSVTVAGRVEVSQRIVGSEREEAAALAAGWVPQPDAADAAETHRQEALGTAAAERAWDDRRLSPRAQAEAAATDEASARHLGEIPARPRPPRSRARGTVTSEE